MPRQGEIVLIPVPFTDLKSKKRRPAIVISNNRYNATTSDIVIVAMTSNPAAIRYGFTIRQTDLEKGKLNRPGKVRVDRVFTLSQTMVLRVFGKVRKAVLARIRKTFRELTSSV
jgi:mRNA interferase MazF